MAHSQTLAELVPQFIQGGHLTSIDTLHGGLINATYLVHLSVEEQQQQLVLQRVNTAVFTKPELVMSNIEKVTKHLRAVAPTARNLHLHPTIDGASYVLDGEGGLWRAFDYLADCIGHEQVSTPAQAYQAGKAFGQFLTQIADLPPSSLAETIPHFHHTPERLRAFDQACSDYPDRASLIEAELEFIATRRSWISTLEDLRERGELPTRTTHNDTKISNVLFDSHTDEAVCVIDLDTVMPGTVLYDFGDLVRTSVNAAKEADGIDAVECRVDIFESLAQGYLESAGDTLTATELDHLVFSAKLITIELALRFLTDHLMGDQYFRTSYAGQNLDRARNQLQLVELLESHEPKMNEIITRLRDLHI